MLRYLITPVLAVVIALSLFWLMQSLIAMSERQQLEDKPQASLSLIKVEPEKPEPEPEDITEQVPTPDEVAAEAANVPTAVPSMTRAPISSPTVAAVSAAAVGDVALDVSVNAAPALGGGTLLAGIGGVGSAKSGKGKGKGFSGTELVPVSTARPQCPKYAVENKIEGWVEIAFFVDKNGQVKNPRPINAQPRGVFEEAAMKAVLDWQYDRYKLGGKTREVKQKIRFRLKDCAMDWR